MVAVRRPLCAKYGDPDLLTPQRRLFIDTVLELGLEPGAILKAYGIAYPSTKPKYRPTAARRLFNEPLIQKALARAKEELRERHHITLDRIVMETAKIAFGDVRDIVSWDDDGVRVTPSAELTLRGAALISEVDIVKTGTNGSAAVRTRLKTNSKLKALDQLARLLGYYDAASQPAAIQLNVDPKELASDVAFLVRAAGAGTPWHRPADILALEKVAGPLIQRRAARPEEELKEDDADEDQNASDLAVAEDSGSASNSKPDAGTQQPE